MPEEVKTRSEQEIKNDDLRAEILGRRKTVEAFYGPWDLIAKEDYAFAMGDQWSAEDRETLKTAGRPCLTFNRIRPIINLVSGYQRENSARIKVNPEGGEDATFSEVCDKGLHFIDKTAHLSYKMGYLFDDGIICGKGFLESILTFDNDPIRGEIQFKQRTPYQVRVDPDCTEYDMNEGARYLFKGPVRLSKDDLIGLYPDKTNLIKGFAEDNDDPMANGSGVLSEGDDDDYGNRPNATSEVHSVPDSGDEESDFEGDEKFTLFEYWRKKRITKYFVIDKESKDAKKFDKKEDAEVFIAKQAFGKVIERKVPEIWVAAMVAGHIVQDIVSPFEPYYSGYPFFRFIADWSPNAEEEVSRVQGMTRQVKDPQREKNKAKSQTLHILNTQANSGWIGDENSLSPTGWKDLESIGSKPGITVKVKKGYYEKLREILPKGPNVGHIQREQAADEEFKQILGINPDLMGMTEGTASGRAIALRVKQAILSLVRIFQNYRYTKEILGKFLLEVMPMIFDEAKLMKVLGPKYMKSVKSEPYENGLTAGNIAAFLTMIKDNKYDVLVTEADQNTTIRFETFQELIEAAKAGVQIPPDLLIEYMDLSNKEEVTKRIQDWMSQLAAASANKGAPGAR
jgi:hypothetical protein